MAADPVLELTLFLAVLDVDIHVVGVSPPLFKRTTLLSEASLVGNAEERQGGPQLPRAASLNARKCRE